MKITVKKKRRKENVLSYRKPTYGAGLRLAQIVLELQARPLGWSLEGIAEELGIHPKTAGRYATVLTKELQGKGGEPVVELTDKWERPTLLLRSHTSPGIDFASSHILSLYLATQLLGFIRGLPAYSSLEEILAKSIEKLPAAERRKLASLGKKIYYVPDGPKDYSRHASLLNMVVRAVFDQKKIMVKYRSPYGSGKEWTGTYAPYTLMLYKRGLYLIGHSDKHGEVRFLAVERIIEVEATSKPFNLPVNYSPSLHTEGSFGIMTGEPVDVSIRFEKWTEPLISGRRWHPTQRIEKLPNGDIRLRLRVRGTDELLPWVMTFGPNAKVEAPPALVASVSGWAQEMRRLYLKKA